jgi:hypothetical protein
MQIEKATRYNFENQSSVTIHRTAVNASMGDEQVTLNTLNEHDLLLAVCSYIDCIKYRNSDEMPKYFEPLERSVAKLREFIEDEKHKTNAWHQNSATGGQHGLILPVAAYILTGSHLFTAAVALWEKTNHKQR